MARKVPRSNAEPRAPNDRSGGDLEHALLRAQIRLQVLSYASIYEAVLHHILFSNLASESAVIVLTEFPMKKIVSIPTASREALEKYLEHDAKRLFRHTRESGKLMTLKFVSITRRNALTPYGS
jgi:hypothetical protein